MSSPFDTMPLAQDANASAQSRQELQAKLNGLGGLNGRNLSPEAREKKLREACEGFESIFIQKMWQEMRNTVPKGGLLHGNEERFWQDMYDQELAKSMTSAGGIGLADMMYEQLSRNLVSASRSAVGQAQGGAFVPQAAPLMSQSQEELPAEKQEPIRTVASIYDGEAPHMGQANKQASGVEVGEDGKTAQASQLPTPPVTPVAVAETPKAEPASKPKKSKSVKAHAPGESSGLQLAYLARRDAGDKLGANAIRPPLHARKQTKVEAEQPQTQTVDSSLIRQAGNINPGSMEGIQAALANARTGAANIEGSQSPQLHDIVAQVQAQNAMNAMQQTAAFQTSQTQEAPAVASVEPVTRKVRYTTNIPGKTKNSKKNEAIRMLNVENVGVNSKAGQGLAAYHAAQEAFRTEPAQVAASQTPAATEAAPQTPIAPLTAQAVQTDATQANFAIPPLKANDLKG